MSAIKDTWRKPPFISNPLVRYGFYAAVAIYFVVTLATLPIDWARVSDGMTRAQRIFSGAFPPSFERSGLLIDGFLESLKIAILATVGGIAISVPLAFMAASNISIRPIYLLGRGIIIVARSFHPVIVAIIFVKAVGFGPFAGALTLVVYSVGFVAKLLAERIEEIDFGQVEAMRSAGAGFIATLAYAVMPQIMPRLVGLGIYQLDSNLRASAVVGIVGAGGIGFYIQTYVRSFQYDKAASVTIAVVVMVIAIEAINVALRRRFT